MHIQAKLDFNQVEGRGVSAETCYGHALIPTRHLARQTTDIGVQKKGDLAALYVYKFHSSGQLYLLGYSLDDSVRLVYLEAVGPHENFYRDLKR